MSQAFFQCECTVETDASPAFVWNWWTDVRNWSDPPAEFTLDGPFAGGSLGNTTMPGQPQRQWVITHVGPGACATIEAALDGATMSSSWKFEAIAGGRTRITQRIELAGENAAAYRQAGEMFRDNLSDGMNKIAEAMAAAEGRSKN
jgi:Polyketide cyclase / dehydrase and lipid transport